MEVEATVSNIIGLKDATSYGVEVPETDGLYSFLSCDYNTYSMPIKMNKR